MGLGGGFLLVRVVHSRVSRQLLLPAPPSCCHLLLPPSLAHQRLLSSLPSEEKLDPRPPFAYYTVLQLPRGAKQSQVKAAFFQLAQVHHPDIAGEGETARENFAAITLAYNCLRDPTEKYHYDIHGVVFDELKKKAEESIYTWEPKYDIHKETFTVDSEATEVEDWETAQNYVHSPSLYHRVSTAWADTKGGFRFYNFPWQWGLFFLSVLAWGGGIFIFREALIRYMRRCVESGKYRVPIKINDKWDNPDQYDILWYAGIRKNRSDQNPTNKMTFPASSSGRAPVSEMEREREWKRKHHVPANRPKEPSRYSHTIYSNTRSRGKKVNEEKHKEFLRQKKEEMDKVAMRKEEIKRKNLARFKEMKRKRATRDGFTLSETEKQELVGEPDRAHLPRREEGSS